VQSVACKDCNDITVVALVAVGLTNRLGKSTEAVVITIGTNLVVVGKFKRRDCR